MPPDIDSIRLRCANLIAWGVTNGKDLTMAEVLTVDVPALIAEVERLRS